MSNIDVQVQWVTLRRTCPLRLESPYLPTRNLDLCRTLGATPPKHPLLEGSLASEVDSKGPRRQLEFVRVDRRLVGLLVLRMLR